MRQGVGISNTLERNDLGRLDKIHLSWDLRAAACKEKQWVAMTHFPRLP